MLEGVDYSPRPEFAERFWAKVNKTAGCWLWKGALDEKGYGRFWDKKHWRAHRWSYEYTQGKPEAKLEPDHLCRVRSCVRPEHLEWVDHRTNVLRGNSPAAVHAVKTHCNNGHTFNERNTKWYDGRRYCRECHKIISRKWMRKSRAMGRTRN